MTTSPPPDGYLGTDARITSGPAPELVHAGYELEIRDAPLLHRGLTLADLAHVVALAESGAVDAATLAPLRDRLIELLDVPADEFPYDPRYGDAYNSRERELQRTLGDAAGWLHLGRTRREAGRIAFRLALRTLLLDLHQAAEAFAAALAAGESTHAETLWADSTYLQPAQPSTFGHYLGGFAEQVTRHLERIETAYLRVDVSPGGAGGAGGSRLPLDRNRIAELLGFSRTGRHTRDAMWSTDAPIDAVTAACQLMLTVDQLAEDLEIYASPAFGYVTLDASLCRASVLMPQKRNPYALAVIRGGAGTLVGRLTGLLTSGRTPSARTDNWLYAYGEVAGSLRLATTLTRLAAAVVSTITVHTDVLRRDAETHQVWASDLAEDIALRHGLDYRTAYRVVGHAVATMIESGGAELTADALAAAASAVGTVGVDLPAPDLAAGTDVERLVAARGGLGGAAPARVRDHAHHVERTLGEVRRWRRRRREHADRAEHDLVTAARALGAE